jgi:hypothetical protein
MITVSGIFIKYLEFQHFMKSGHVDCNVENILYGHVQINGGVGCNHFVLTFIPELFQQVPKAVIVLQKHKNYKIPNTRSL